MDEALCSYTFDIKEAAGLISSVTNPSLTVSFLADSLTFKDQLTLKSCLQQLLRLDEDFVFENNHGELSPASYRLAAAFPHSDYCIAGSERLARLAEMCIRDRL